MAELIGHPLTLLLLWLCGGGGGGSSSSSSSDRRRRRPHHILVRTVFDVTLTLIYSSAFCHTPRICNSILSLISIVYRLSLTLCCFVVLLQYCSAIFFIYVANINGFNCLLKYSIV